MEDVVGPSREWPTALGRRRTERVALTEQITALRDRIDAIRYDAAAETEPVRRHR